MIASNSPSTCDEYLRLQRDCTVTPTVIRQEHWVIVKNLVTGAHIRLHRDLWTSVLELDGSRSVHQWLQSHAQAFGEQQLLSVIAQLKNLGIVDSPYTQHDTDSWVGRLFLRHNPLMLRVPLFNPVALLDFLCKVMALINVKVIIAVFYAVILSALYTTMTSWSSIVDFWQSTDSRAQFWYAVLLYPLTKSLHELAHGLLLRRLGGEVPEAGISFIVLFPMPYVDATDAWTLHRRQRMHVTAAGMMMDVLVASIGILLWFNLSSGVIANAAFTVALMGVVSVLLFNANPLLKFDGYYLLEDALDSPGLARRSQAYYRYLFKRYVLALDTSAPPVVARGEKFWMLGYGLGSTFYRFFITALICVYLVSTLHELGILLSLFSLIPLIVLPAYRFSRFLFVSNELTGLRARSLSVISVLFLFTAGFLFKVPMPSSTRTQGIVWVDQQAEVYAGQSGQLEKILVSNGESVQKGQPLMVLASVDLIHEMEQKRAAVRLAQMDVARYRQTDPGLAASALIGLRHNELEVDNTRQQVDQLVVRSPVKGRVALDHESVTTGMYVSQGSRLAYVIDAHERVVRAVVSQSTLGNVDAGVNSVRVRLAHSVSKSVQASITRQEPSGSHVLPSAALINTGMDGFDVENTGVDEPVRTREKVFHLELLLDGTFDDFQQVPMGTRAFVTLVHASEPLAPRWIRVSRQLLLKHLSV